MFHRIIIKFIILIVLTSFTANKKGNILFKIERSKDKNIINYEFNTLNDGSIDNYKPILIHWKKSSGNTEDLTWVQDKYAYGIKVMQRSKDFVKFQFVSYEKKDFFLIRRKNGYSVIHQDKQKVIELNRIYIHFKGGSFWNPSIPQVDIEGVDTLTSKSYKTIIYIK